MNIPLSKIFMPPEARLKIMQTLENGKLAGDGVFCHESEEKLQTMLQANHALVTTSCTHALEMAIMLLDASSQDEVILPSFTFSSTANAILMAGLKPVFCEIDPATMNMDPADVEKKITKRTKAILPVHYAGVACDMDKILDLGRSFAIMVIEDAAQAIGSAWQDVPLGTLGKMGAMSFHETKNVACGEGGAFFTHDPQIAEQAKIIREKGTNRAQFLRGQVDKYTWVGKGSSYILAEPLAAILSAQLDNIANITTRRKHIWQSYQTGLADLARHETLTLPTVPLHCTSNAHIFHILLRTPQHRDSLMAYLRQHGIGATFHYIPLHSSPMGISLGYRADDLPLTESSAARLLRLPLYPDMSQSHIDYVLEHIWNWDRLYKGVAP